jgi:hypothetical protein
MKSYCGQAAHIFLTDAPLAHLLIILVSWERLDVGVLPLHYPSFWLFYV